MRAKSPTATTPTTPTRKPSRSRSALQQISREYNATRMSVDAQLLAESLSDAPSNLEPDLRAEAAWIAGLPPLDVKDATATNMLGEAFGRLDGLCEQYR